MPAMSYQKVSRRGRAHFSGEQLTNRQQRRAEATNKRRMERKARKKGRQAV
jgi:hypothetical protein